MPGSSSQATLGLPPNFKRLRQYQEQVEQGQRGYLKEINGDAILAAIEQLESRFDGMEQRLDGIVGRLDGIVGRVDGIVGRLDVMDTRQQAAYVSYTPLNNMRIQC
jgi:hypothetical protein